MKQIKKLTALLLSLSLLITALCLSSVSANAEERYSVPASRLSVGDVFEMGMYPQSGITDEATLEALSAIDCTMQSYGYMKNADNSAHTFDTVDMCYADIAYNGDLYRKVTINEYRPCFASPDLDYYARQQENGYSEGSTYYFRWEPIEWRVLSNDSNGVYVISSKVLDSQPYHNFYENVTWETCSLRSWLNGDFYNLAFSDDEKSTLVMTTLVNENNAKHDTDGGNDTQDNIWVISFSDSLNADYGFISAEATEDPLKRAFGSEYAKCQGLRKSDVTEYPDTSVWWMRTPGKPGDHATICGYEGKINHTGGKVLNSGFGIRPAFKLRSDSEVSVSAEDVCRIAGHSRGEWKSVDDTNHERACSVCGETETEAHSWNGGEITAQPSYNQTGTRTYTCTVCGGTKTESIPAIPTPAETLPVKEKAPELYPKIKNAKSSVRLTWKAVEGAERYEIYASYYGKKFKKVKTLKGSATKYSIKKLNGKKLKQNKNVQAFIVAYRIIDGQYVQITKSPAVYTAGKRTKYTNVKKIKLTEKSCSLKINESRKIKAKTVLENKKKKALKCTAKLRYITSDDTVAAVSNNGKIAAVGAGSCTITVYANNGVYKTVRVTVE